MKLKALCDATSIECPQNMAEMEIESIETDSRYVKKGSMFICIQGLHTDGHLYIDHAIAAGAVCILAQDGCLCEKNVDVPILFCENTRRAAAFLYHAWYGFPSQKLKVIGVTGTNGKTSVTHLLRSIFEGCLCRCGLIGTVGCESVGRRLSAEGNNRLANMTTPDPEVLYRLLAEMVKDRVEYVLMEVTSHALALEKLAPIRFDAAIFTNLTPEHLDFHGTMDAYAAAKTKLFAQSKLSIINTDSPYATRMINSAAATVVSCAVDRFADYTAESCDFAEDGVGYVLKSSKANIRLFCPIPGRFSVINSMQAVVCALELGFHVHCVKDSLASVAGVRGRMERVKLGLGADFSVLIDYAHTPDALEHLLRTVKQIRKDHQRVVLLFGCGGDRDRGKRRIMGLIASRDADELIITSDNSRSEDPNRIIQEILEGVDKQASHRVIPDRAEAIRQAVLGARQGDILILAGKGHEEYEIVGEERRAFSEKEIVRNAFSERLRLQHQNDSTEIES